MAASRRRLGEAATTEDSSGEAEERWMLTGNKLQGGTKKKQGNWKEKSSKMDGKRGGKSKKQ